MRTMSGADEGVFGWVAANYILGNFVPQSAVRIPETKSTVHALDMGGSSLEITGENLVPDNTNGNVTSVIIAGKCPISPLILPQKGNC